MNISSSSASLFLSVFSHEEINLLGVSFNQPRATTSNSLFFSSFLRRQMVYTHRPMNHAIVGYFHRGGHSLMHFLSNRSNELEFLQYDHSTRVTDQVGAGGVQPPPKSEISFYFLPNFLKSLREIC